MAAATNDKLQQLKNTFVTFDLDGEGQVDKMSFVTALGGCAIEISTEVVDQIFSTLDPQDTGNIDYNELIALVNKKQLGEECNLPEEFTEIFGQEPEKELTEEDQEQIHKAIVVIKKAIVKGLGRNEVNQFLGQKGVRSDLIDRAYKLAESDINPQQRIRHYKELSEEKSRLAADYAHNNKKLKRINASLTKENKNLTDMLSVAVDMVVTSYKQASSSYCPSDVINEVKDFVSISTEKVAHNAGRLLTLLESRRFVVAWLLFQTLPFKSELSNTDLFLADFDPQSDDN